jgi:LmbE family N-acetylglucosaminyl deacetylase
METGRELHPAPDPPDRVLVVAAHPDDETLGAGGTIARHVENGDEVWVCLVSDGVGARHEHAELQRRCAEKACGVLGVQQVRFCGLPDQGLDGLPLLDLIRPIEDCIEEFRPSVVYTHFMEDVNQDHRCVFRAVMVATRPVGDTTVRRVLCFETPSSTEWAPPFPGNVFSPSVFVDVSATLKHKIDALTAYEHTYMNEVHPYPHPRSYKAVRIYAQRHGIAVGMLAAEPFMLVRQLI